MGRRFRDLANAGQSAVLGPCGFYVACTVHILLPGDSFPTVTTVGVEHSPMGPFSADLLMLLASMRLAPSCALE